MLKRFLCRCKSMAAIQETVVRNQPELKSPTKAYCLTCHQLYEPDTRQCSFCLTPLSLITGFKLSNGKFIPLDYLQKVRDVVTKYLDEKPGFHFYTAISDSVKRKVSHIGNPDSLQEVLILLSSFRGNTIARSGGYYMTKSTVTDSRQHN